MKLILCFYGPTEFCLLPNDDGEGTNFAYYVYYDAANDQCSPMLYKGNGGNANRFSNEIECIRNCSSKAEQIYPMDGKAILNICISIWLLGCCLGTLEQAVTNEVMIYDL